MNKQGPCDLIETSGPNTKLLIRAIYETAARVSELLNIMITLIHTFCVHHYMAEVAFNERHPAWEVKIWVMN